MRKSLNAMAGLLCCFLLGQSILTAEAAQGVETAQEEKDDIVTDLEAEGSDVTLTIGIRGGSQVTSGRLVVYYDSNLLELSETETGNLWTTEDVNEDITEDERAGVAYAWADTSKLTEEGSLITLSFQAAEEADGREIWMETRILELYSEQTALVPAWEKKTDKVKIRLNDSKDKPDNQESGQQEEDKKTRERKSGSGVQTGDDTNVAGWILTAFGAVLVILNVGRKSRMR